MFSAKVKGESFFDVRDKIEITFIGLIFKVCEFQ